MQSPSSNKVLGPVKACIAYVMCVPQAYTYG